jgi:hypothetical protein
MKMSSFAILIGLISLTTSCAHYDSNATGAAAYIPTAKGYTFSNIKRIRGELPAEQYSQVAAPSISALPEPAPQQNIALVDVELPVTPEQTLPTAAPIAEAAKMMDFVVNPGESYRAALSRWLWADSVNYIAFDPALEEFLARTADGHQRFPAVDVTAAAQDLLRYNGGKLTLFNGLYKTAAVHTFTHPQIVITRGRTLMEAVSGVAGDYGWSWDDDKNWLLKDDFNYSNKHVIVTEEQDIASALTQLLHGYPVRVEQHHSTKQIFIVEDGATYD